MQIKSVSILFSSSCAALLLASALTLSACAQDAPAAAAPAPAAAAAPKTPAQEGFWGRVNPFARKKWVNKRLSPMNDRLTELDEVNAKNGAAIQDVDGRAQAGINKAQSTADAANSAANAAGDAAKKASATAQNASGRIDQLNAQVAGLDQYKQVKEADIAFKSGQAVLSAEARKQLDELAASLKDNQGFLLEIEAFAPGAGAAGIQASSRLADAVKRYLVTEHQIPVYRLHAIALGNAAPGADAKAVKTSSVHVLLLENNLAASR